MHKVNVPHLRNSERSSFKRCPQRWWWAYREGLRPIGQPSAPLWFGTGIHLAFAEWYIPGTKRGVPLQETWESYIDGEIVHIKSYSSSGDNTEERAFKYVEAKELGNAMLEGYLDEYGNDENWDVINPEQVFAVLIPNSYGEPIIELNGTFDGVYRDLNDGMIKLMEHKTAAVISTKHLSLDDQAGTYWAVAGDILRKKGLIGKRERLDGITYNFLKKSTPDDRLVGPDGMVHNLPTKPHYLAALNRYEMENEVTLPYQPKTAVAALLALAAQYRIPVWGEVSKNQPTKNFVREYVKRTAVERRTQIERIANEAEHMNAMRSGDLPLYKTPTRDCSWDCDFFAMCELHESTPDWKDYRDAMYKVEDPYAAHRKST